MHASLTCSCRNGVHCTMQLALNFSWYGKIDCEKEDFKWWLSLLCSRYPSVTSAVWQSSWKPAHYFVKWEHPTWTQKVTQLGHHPWILTHRMLWLSPSPVRSHLSLDPLYKVFAPVALMTSYSLSTTSRTFWPKTWTKSLPSKSFVLRMLRSPHFIPHIRQYVANILMEKWMGSSLYAIRKTKTCTYPLLTCVTPSVLEHQFQIFKCPK